MKMKSISFTILAAVLNFVFLVSPVFAAEVSGQVISFSCSGCHGTDGLLVKPGMAKLKSQAAGKLEESLLGFKYDKKPASIMGRITKGYTDKELKAVAQYFSHLK